MKPRLKTLTTVILCLLAITVVVWAADIPAGGFAGTWKCNIEKSVFPGPPPQSEVFTIGPDSSFSITIVGSDGKTSTFSYKPQAGQAVPVEGRGPDVTVILRKVSAHKVEHTWNNKGKTSRSYTILSKDGKTQTYHAEGVNPEGKHFTETVVYEKQ